MKDSHGLLLDEDVAAMFWPDLFDPGRLFSQQELKETSNKVKLLEAVEKLLLKHNPFLYLHRDISFLYLTPVLSKINDVLSEILNELKNSTDTDTAIKPEDLEAFRDIFIRASNIFRRSITDSGKRSQCADELDDVPTSYLNNLVEFLQYCQDPVYIIVVVSTTTKYLRKITKKTSGLTERLVSVRNLLQFGKSFVRLLVEHDQRPSRLLTEITPFLGAECKYSQWESYLEHLLHYTSPEELEKLVEFNQNSRVHTKVASLTAKKGLNRYHVAGEIAFLNFISNKSNILNYEITAVALSLVFISGMLINNNKNENKNKQNELTNLYNLANNFNFSDFGLRIASTYSLEIKTKSKDTSQNGETASMRILAIDLLLFYLGTNEAIITNVGESAQAAKQKRRDFEDKLKEEVLDLLDSNGSSENSNFRESFTYQILDALDSLIFSSGDHLQKKRLAYLDGFKLLSHQAVGVECLGSLVHFYKAYKNALKEKKRMEMFKCLDEIVRKRLKNLQISNYSITLLPDYFKSLQMFCRILQTRNEIAVLSEAPIEFLTEALKELRRGNQLEPLLTDPFKGDLAQMQLRSFVFGHLPLSFDNPGKNDMLDEDAIDKVRLSTLIDSKSVIELFGIPEKDEKKKNLQGVLFFALLSNYFLLDSHVQDNPSEETTQALVNLISKYHSPEAPDFRFLRLLLDYLPQNDKPINLKKSLLKSHFVNETLRNEIWFNDKVLRWETVAGYESGLVDYLFEGLHAIFEEMERPSGESKIGEEGEQHDQLIKTQKHKAKEVLLELIRGLKHLVSKTDDLGHEAAQGKVDPLILALYQDLISTHTRAFRDFFQSVSQYLDPEEAKEILFIVKELFKTDWIQQDIFEISNLIQQVSAKIKPEEVIPQDVQVIRGYILVMEILSQLNETTFDLFGSQESTKNLARHEIDDFARISYLVTSWQAGSLTIFGDFNLEHLEEKEKRASPAVIQCIYRVIRGILGGSGSFKTDQIPSMRIFGKRSTVIFATSVLSLLFSGVISADHTLHSGSINTLLESLAKLFEIETLVLKEYKEEKLGSKPPLQIYRNINSLLHVMFLLAENLDQKPSDRMKSHSLDGYMKIAFHQGLLERFIEFVEASENYDELITLKSDASLLEKVKNLRSDIKTSIISFTDKISRKLLFDSPQDTFRRFKAEGYSEKEQLEMVDRVSQLNYRIFSSLHLFHYTIFAQEGQLPTKDLQIMNLLFSQIIQELSLKTEGEFIIILPPIQEVADEGSFSATRAIQTFPKNSDGTADPAPALEIATKMRNQDLTVFQQKREDVLSHTVTKYFPKILRQIILLHGVVEMPQRELLKSLTQEIVQKLHSNEDSQKFIHSLQEEVQSVFQAFANESAQNLSSLTVKHLPSIQIHENAGVNTFLSALLYIRFYEEILRKLFPEKQGPLEFQKLDVDASSQAVYEKLLLLSQKLIKKLLKVRLFSELIEPFSLTSSEFRVKEHFKLYEVPCSEFKDHEKTILETIYQGALMTITNHQYYPERAVVLDSFNLLAVTVWESSYLDRIQKENVIDLLLNLEGESKASVVPFILDRLIGNRIPIHTQIEIALKGAFLKPISFPLLEQKNSLYYLQVLNQSDPKTFTLLCKELLVAVETNSSKESNEQSSKKNKKDKARTINDSSIKLKDDVDPLRLSQTKEEIQIYLKNSLTKITTEIIDKLLHKIVSDNEKAWGKHSEGEDYEEFATKIDQNLYVLSALLSKYPELRIYTAEAKVQTRIHDQKTLHFSKLPQPQEITFLDYLIHVISPVSYPQTAGAIRGFYEEFTPAFTLRVDEEIVTSHEYFRGLVLNKSMAALSILSEKSRFPHYRSLLYVYPKLIRDALDSEISQPPGNSFFFNLESVISKFVSKGKSLSDLRDLYRLFGTQLWLQMGTAFSKLDPKYPFGSLIPEDSVHMYARFLLYHDRDYTKLESYSSLQDGNSDKTLKKDTYELEAAAKTVTKTESEVTEKALKQSPRKMEDDMRALVVRALLEGQELPVDFIINFGRDYYSISKKTETDRIKELRSVKHSKFSSLQYAFLKNQKLSEGYLDDRSAVLSKIQSLEVPWNSALKTFNREIEVEEWAPKEWIEIIQEVNNLEEKGQNYGESLQLSKAQKKEEKQLKKDLEEEKSKRFYKLVKKEGKDSENGSSSSGGSGSGSEIKEDDSFEIIPKAKSEDKIHLFKGLERRKFRKESNKIQTKLSQIIEKKLLTGFLENLNEFGKVQGPIWNKPDPELNIFISSLKNYQQRIALLVLREEYTGMLSKSFQIVRKKCQKLLNLRENREYRDADSESEGSGSEEPESAEKSEKSGSNASEEEGSGEEEKISKADSQKSGQSGRSGNVKHDSEADDEEENKSEKGSDEEEEKGSDEEEEKGSDEEEKGSDEEEEKGSDEEEEKGEGESDIPTSKVQGTPQKFDGFRKNSQFPGFRDKDVEKILFKNTETDLENKALEEAREIDPDSQRFYIYHKKNSDAMRKTLFLASTDFIDHFLANFITSSDYLTLSQIMSLEEDSGSNEELCFKYSILKGLEIFILLCCNPLNEIRLLDSILTLLSFDCENEGALAAFNEYFGIALTPIQLQQNRSKFVESIIFIFTRYYAVIPKQRSGFESDNFDRLIAETEALTGASSLKKRLLPHCPLLETSPKNFLLEFAVIATRSGISTRVATKAVRFILTIKNIRKNLSSQSEPEAIAKKIADVADILIILNPEQPENLGGVTVISHLLENEEVFFNFLDLCSKNSGSMFKLIEFRLQNTVSGLKRLSEGTSSAWSLVQNQIERLSQDQLFRSLRLTMRLIANQSQNFLDELNQTKGRLKKSDYNLILRLKEALSDFQVKKRFGNAYLLLVQTFELLETIKKSNPQIQKNLKPLSVTVDIAIDAYRIFKLQEKMSEKFEEQQYLLKNLSNPETIQPIKPGFMRVATKTEDEDDDRGNLGGDLTIPGFDRSFSQIKQSGAIKIEELFLRLSHKAKNIIQSIVLEGIIKAKKKGNRYAYSDDEEENNTVFDLSKIGDMALLGKFPWLLKFEAKQSYIYSKLKQDRKRRDSDDSDRSNNTNVDIKVRRDYIVKDTLDHFQKILLAQNKIKLPSIKFKIKFASEEGVDQGGLENEWLNLVVKDLFDPAHGLFRVAENGVTIQPSAQSQVISNYLSYFRLAGCIVGYSIVQKKPIVVSFTRPFLKQILNKEISITDLADVDEKLYQSLSWILRNTLEEGVLEQDFSYEIESFGRRLKVSLTEPGEKFGMVNEENKKLYTKRLVYWKLVKEIEPQVNAFKEGFYKFVKLEHLSFFSSSELDKLIAGSPTINFEELQQTTKYNGYSTTSNIIKWLWQIVSGFDQESLSALLFFATGMNRVGPAGFKGHPLTIKRINGGSQDNLPTAHTCSAQIDLPEYPTKEILAEKLLLAILEGREGFSFS